MTPRLPPRLRFAPVVLLIALLCCAVMTGTSWNGIRYMGFPDSDDALRYVQVRDFLNGQSWFDVSQHRVNPPFGGPMHWSRLVDVPLAGMILLFRPLFGATLADKITLAVEPMLLLCALFAMLALAVRRIAGEAYAVVAAAFLAISMPILLQFRPVRIDHHGWQVLMAAIALWATFDPRQRRGGLIAGAAMAFWIHVSSEGLPYAIMFGGLYGLWFLGDRAQGQRLSAYLPMLVAGSALLLIGTRGWPEAAKPYCDAMSPVYLLPMLVVALLLPLARRVIGETSWPRRLIALGLAGGIGGATYLLNAGECLAGPFETLDPITYRYWYLQVAEGRPIWEQSSSIATILLFPSIAGIIGTVLAARQAATSAEQDRWITVLLPLLGAFAISLMVMRTMAAAHLFAIPGMVWILFQLFPKAQGLRHSVSRIFATAGLFLLTPLGLCLIAALVSDPLSASPAPPTKPVKRDDAHCGPRDNFATLARLPRGTIFASIDIGPRLLAFTPHNIVATGQHRNHVAIKDVILAFTETPDAARAIVARHHAAYFAYRPGLPEVVRYAEGRPHALITTLQADRPPSWLQPVAMPVCERIRVYRVLY